MIMIKTIIFLILLLMMMIKTMMILPQLMIMNGSNEKGQHMKKKYTQT